MNIYELLSKKESEQVAKMESFQAEQQNGIKIAYSEDTNLDSADSFEDFVDGGFSGDDNSQQGMDSFDRFGGGDDFGGGFDDFSGGDGQQGPEGNLPMAAIEFLENIDESEVHIVEKLLTNFSNLYSNQLSTYHRVVSYNLETTDFKDSIVKIKDQYKRSLAILRSYITEKYKNESTVARVEVFVEFKNIFTKLSDEVNDILNKLENR